ncbi:MAG: cytochrome c peroxidase [Bryobacteraceae bacterium]
MKIATMIGIGAAAGLVWIAAAQQEHHSMEHGHGKGGMRHGPMSMMGTLPEEVGAAGRDLSSARIDLGRMLYYDPRLSSGRDVSCNSCHPLDKYGVDGKARSSGHKGQLGGRNAPTVYNAAGHVAQFWDGRAADVEEQAKGPVMNPVEMAMSSPADVEKTLQSIPGYVKAFRKAFPGEKDPVTFDNMAIAIGAFERKLVTPSRWDRWLKGDSGALSAEEMDGWHVFHMAGCQTCHSGPFAGGQVYRKLGQVHGYPDLNDAGRFDVTKKEEDRGVFKVPSLRNVAKTGPWFHDGSITSLEDAIRLMAHHQLGRELTSAEVRSLVAFLNSLTGDLPRGYIRPPKLPADGM